MICQCCGVEAPTKYVELHQNIGALVMRFHKAIRGDLCKLCINKYFWEFTLINLTLGWWGMISLIMTPLFLINNLIHYLMCWKMQPVPLGATPPTLTDEAIRRLEPYTDELITRLNGREKLEQVVESIAPRARVTPGQVVLYFQALYQSTQKQN